MRVLETERKGPDMANTKNDGGENPGQFPGTVDPETVNAVLDAVQAGDGARFNRFIETHVNAAAN